MNSSNISLDHNTQDLSYEEYGSIIDYILGTNCDTTEKKKLYYSLLSIFENSVYKLTSDNEIENLNNNYPISQINFSFYYSQFNPLHSPVLIYDPNYIYLSSYFPNIASYPNQIAQPSFNQQQLPFFVNNSIQSKKEKNKTKKSHKKSHKHSKNDKSSKHNQTLKKDVKFFKYKEGSELNGIFRFLTDKTKGNIHDNGTIEITSNSILSDDHPRNLVDYENDNFYQCEDRPNAYVCFDFKKMSVHLTNYTIKNGDSLRHFYLRNWAVEVSLDGQNWTEIDHHENDPILNGAFNSHTFTVSEKDGFYRFVRLRLFNKNWSTESHKFTVWFPFIEFFGKLKNCTK